jgi:hypothetical protein
MNTSDSPIDRLIEADKNATPTTNDCVFGIICQLPDKRVYQCNISSDLIREFVLMQGKFEVFNELHAVELTKQ